MRTELHFHLLPGVDDGPRDHREAIELARLAVTDGTGRVVCTPHARLLDFAQLPARVGALRDKLAAARVPLQITGGAELSPDDVPHLSERELELAAQGPPGARWLLLEAPLFPTRPDLSDAAAQLRRRGYGVLIGHPERSATTSMADVAEQVDLGAVLQVNASSLVGAHGREVRKTAAALAGSSLPFMVASDAHSRGRPPLLRQAAAALASAGLDPAAVRHAIDTLPERLLSEGLAAATDSPQPS